ITGAGASCTPLPRLATLLLHSPSGQASLLLRAEDPAAIQRLRGDRGGDGWGWRAAPSWRDWLPVPDPCRPDNRVHKPGSEFDAGQHRGGGCIQRELLRRALGDRPVACPRGGTAGAL